MLGVCVRLATFAPWKPILRKNKNKKAAVWRDRLTFPFRNVTVIIFEDCNDEEHVASAVYKVWSVTYRKTKGILTGWRVPIQINFEFKDRGSGVPKENIVQNHLNMAMLNVF